jgi:hypothetical protein
MPYPVFTKQDLADFSGRPVASYTGYTDRAIRQAVLLFKIGTCLANLAPKDTLEYEIAVEGILAMADQIFLAQRYQQQVASPFQSESLGSYSYSKTAKSVSDGEKTGVEFFDIAIDQLSVCDETDDIPSFGGVEVFEHDGMFARGEGGNLRFLSPKDLDQSRSYGFDPAGSQTTPVSVPEYEPVESSPYPGNPNPHDPDDPEFPPVA